MRLIALPIAFSLAFIAFEHSDKIVDLYRAAYPSDPVKREALGRCALSPNFNRLDPDDREACYAAAIGLPLAAVALAPSASPYYPYSPSSLPGDDVRRQEANDGYEPKTPVPAGAAAAATLTPAAASMIRSSSGPVARSPKATMPVPRR